MLSFSFRLCNTLSILSCSYLYFSWWTQTPHCCTSSLPRYSHLAKLSILSFSQLIYHLFFKLSQLEISVFWGSLLTCIDSVHSNHSYICCAFCFQFLQCLLLLDDKSMWQLFHYLQVFLEKIYRTAILGRDLFNPVLTESSKNLAAKSSCRLRLHGLQFYKSL